MARQRPSRKASARTKPPRSRRSSKKPAPKSKSSNYGTAIGPFLTTSFESRRGSLQRTAPEDFITQVEAGYYHNSKRLLGAFCVRVRADFWAKVAAHDSLSLHNCSCICPQGMR